MHPLDLRNGKIVYFDMFGLFIVAYSQDRAFVINESIAILVVLELIFKIKKARQDGTSRFCSISRYAFSTDQIIPANCFRRSEIEGTDEEDRDGRLLPDWLLERHHRTQRAVGVHIGR